MYPFVLFATIVLFVSCGEPSCPSGYTKYGDTCRRCPPGQEREGGRCVSLDGDDGDATLGGGHIPDPAESGGDARTGDAVTVAADGASMQGAAPDATAGLADAGPSAPASDAASLAGDGAASMDDATLDASTVMGNAEPSDATARPINHCAPNPCQRGAACIEGPTGFSCECPSGSSGDRCELEICGDTTIRSAADLRTSRLCAEVRGNLSIASSGLVTIEAQDLPHLTKVTGDLRIAALNGSAATPLVQSMTFAALKVVEGTLFLGGTTPGAVSQVYFPALTTIGKVAGTTRRLHLEAAPDVQVLEFPVLSTVHGSVSIALLNRLCTLKLGAISLVTGNVTLGVLPNLPASTFAALRSAAQGSVAQQQVGCCAAVDNVSCEAFTADSRATYCGC